MVFATNNKTRKFDEKERRTTKREVRKEAKRYANPSEKRARKRQRKKKKEGRGVSREREFHEPSSGRQQQQAREVEAGGE